MNFNNDKAIYIQIADRLCDEILAGNFETVFTSLEDMMLKNGITNPQDKKNELNQYVKRNLPKMMMVLFSSQLTLDDLKLCLNIASKPSYQHAMDAVVEMTSDPLQLGIDIMSKMAVWMNKYYPKYAAPLQSSVEILKSY